MRSRWLTVLRWLVAVLIIAFAVRELARAWGEVQAQPVAWAPRPAMLLASALVVWAMYGVLIEAWRSMLRGWGEALPWVPAARIWTVSSLGKYLPGKVWAIAGMALMAQRRGVAPWAAMASAIILQAVAIGTGGVVTGVAGARALAGGTALQRAAPWLLAAAAAGGVALAVWPPVMRWLLRLGRVETPVVRTPGSSALAVAIGANLLAWCGYGLALWLLAHGLLDVPSLTPAVAIGAFAASYVAGLVALPAPGGLGVREAVFVLMLDGIIGPAAAIALAIASRILLTLTEFGAAAPFLVLSETPRRD